MSHPDASHPRGPDGCPLRASHVLIVLGVGLVVDGGNALAQRRGSQNASDFGALAGARVIAEWIDGDTTNGTDANVRRRSNAVHQRRRSPTFGAPDGPRYVAEAACSATSGAASRRHGRRQGDVQPAWRPFFLGLFGIHSWTATADATAKGGYSQAGPPPGTLFPVGISLAFFQTYPFCSGPSARTQRPVLSAAPDAGQPQRPGRLRLVEVRLRRLWPRPGSAGERGGCGNNKPFLQDEIGPPSKTYGCCTAVGLPGSLDRIGSLPGNKASADCSYYIDNEITVTVPIWDTPVARARTPGTTSSATRASRSLAAAVARTSKACGARRSSRDP